MAPLPAGKWQLPSAVASIFKHPNKAGMEGRGGGGGGGREPARAPAQHKFAVYKNPALSAAMTARSLEPSRSTLLFLFFISSVSALSLLSISARYGEDGLAEYMRFSRISEKTADLVFKISYAAVGLVFLGGIFALFKAVSFKRVANKAGVAMSLTKDQVNLSNHQLSLLGLKPKANHAIPDSSRKPPKSKVDLTPTSETLTPLHQPITGSGSSSVRSLRTGVEQLSASGGSKSRPLSTPSKSPGASSSLYLVPGYVSPLPSARLSPALDSFVSSPWSGKQVSSSREITSEEKLEQFLAEVDDKITESAGKMATPPPTIGGFGIASPSTVATSANTSGTTRSTPLRPVRMSPGSQKFTTPPKKGEGEFPPPMSPEESVKALKQLGIYPEIESWRDCLRQWFSSVLLKPLLKNIETSHVQVMQAAAKLSISITVSQVGNDVPTGIPTVSPINMSKEWLPAMSIDEDGLLHQLRATLMQSIDAHTSKQPYTSTQAAPQNPFIPLMQECVDAVTEHQKLQALVKGELIKGLLPQKSIPAHYFVRRIRELAEGTCVKNYEFLGSQETTSDKAKKWTTELPTDSHLLPYLFFAFLEHPKWMLHVDPTSYAGAQSSQNPLFLGVLPPKESFPEKYIAAISNVPSTLHPGALILALGRQSPPIFALYWDKKMQFSLQGRTAMWDSILLLCYKVKVGFGGVIRGMHLGSSALSLLPVLDSED